MRRETIWIGFDKREAASYAVTRASCQRWMTRPIPTHGLVLKDLVDAKVSTREIVMKKSTADRDIMWDVISDAAQSTEHANSRFLTPFLAGSGLALFCDGDMLYREDVGQMFDGLTGDKAVYCVQHKYEPPPGLKMDGQEQARYARKNWSSFVVFDCDHPSNRCLTESTDMANSLPGRDLHRFCWLKDDEIGVLDPKWNFLVGHSDPSIDPAVVHFTTGTPDMPGYEAVPYSDLWREELHRWAS